MILAKTMLRDVKDRSMKLVVFRGVLVAALLGLSSGAAQAIPITYEMSGNGGYDNPIGSFTYDAASNTYSNVNIWSLDHYTSARSTSTASFLRSTGLLGTSLQLNFASPLSDAGGAISFTGYEQGLLTLFGRISRSGTVSSSGVPSPNVALLFGIGIIGVLLVPRRERA